MKASPALPQFTSRVSKPSNLKIKRVFSDARVKPFYQIEWDRRTAEITDDSGKQTQHCSQFSARAPKIS